MVENRMRFCDVCGAAYEEPGHCLDCEARAYASRPNAVFDGFDPLDMVTGIGFVAVYAAGLAALFLTLFVPLALWVETDGFWRPILEALPLGEAVADRPGEDGNPVLIGILTAVPVLAVIAALTLWRRGLVRRYLAGRLSYGPLLSSSIVRMFAILMGLPLVFMLASMATGADIESRGPESNALFGPWQLAVFVAGLLAFSYFGLSRRINKDRRKPPRPEEFPPPPGAAALRA